jgi:non-ribosomal peptide synthetase component F
VTKGNKMEVAVATAQQFKCAHHGCRNWFVWNGRGRRKKYCKPSHRQRAYEKRPDTLPRTVKQLHDRLELEMHKFQCQWLPLRRLLLQVNNEVVKRQERNFRALQNLLVAFHDAPDRPIHEVGALGELDDEEADLKKTIAAAEARLAEIARARNVLAQVDEILGEGG